MQATDPVIVLVNGVEVKSPAVFEVIKKLRPGANFAVDTRADGTWFLRWLDTVQVAPTTEEINAALAVFVQPDISDDERFLGRFANIPRARLKLALQRLLAS